MGWLSMMRSMASATHKLERSMAREFKRQEKEERQTVVCLK